MDRKNSMLAWRTRDIVIFILSIVGLTLLLIYGSKAVADANDRRYVEGWRNSPVSRAPATDRHGPYTPVALADVTPMEEVSYQVEPAGNDTPHAAESDLPPQSAEARGNKAGIFKKILPELTKRLN